MSYLKFHYDHVVKCPNEECRSVVLTLTVKRLNVTNNSSEQYYRCMDCGKQFRCCPTTNKVSISMKIQRARSRLKELESMVTYH